ncbi:MAG: hypothetical protein NTY41_17135, partial [Proteobacteria bacterium]|nr:hypothetical protein [Pseudomonadota bacterium]
SNSWRAGTPAGWMTMGEYGAGMPADMAAGGISASHKVRHDVMTSRYIAVTPGWTSAAMLALALTFIGVH